MKDIEWTGNPSRALLAAKEEDRFTTYLMEILKAPIVLRAFLAGTTALDLQEIDVNALAIDTQLSVPGGRPDLVISSPDLLLIFEAKVGAWLHGDQLRTYESFLADWLETHPDGTGALFLIAPESQLPGLEAAAAEEELDWRWTGISWEEIGRLFKDVADKVGSVRLRTHLLDFNDLVTYRLGEMERPFTTEETTLFADRLAGSALWRLGPVIQRTIDALQVAFGDRISISNSQGSFYSGHWLVYRGRKYWFGIWFQAYAYLGFSPLFLQVSESLPFGIEIPAGMPNPMNHQQLQGDIIPLVIESNLAPAELGRIIAAQISALMEEVKTVE